MMAHAQRAPAAQIRTNAVRLIKSIEGKNVYSQNPTRREQVFETPGSGDCSSTARLVLLKAGVGFSIGSNTSSQMGNRTKLGIIVDVSKTGYPNEANLLPGDLLYFKGNTAHIKGVGHVEMYVGDGECSGHGSGRGPKRHNIRTYCRSRISTATRYFMAIRFIFDFGERELLKGRQGADVRMLQAALLELGCTTLGNAGEARDGIDGNFGKATDAGVRWYQAKVGVAITGRVDQALADRIMSDAYGAQVPEPVEDDDEADRDYPLGSRVLDVGDVGADVAELQTGLKRLGYDLGTFGDAGDGVDGEYGSMTAASVLMFQTKNGLPGTAVFDGSTFTAFTVALAALLVDEVGQIIKYPVRRVIADLSAYQGPVDAKTVAERTDFVIYRFRVCNKPDKTAIATAKSIIAQGGIVAGYDYTVFTTPTIAEQMADAFYNACIALGIRLLYGDLEQLAEGVGYGKTIECARAYFKRLKARAQADGIVIKVGLYTGDYRWNAQLYKLADVLDDVWLAAWGKNNGYLSAIPKKRVGGLHQLTSMGGSRVNGAWVDGCPGVGRRVDLNRLTGQKPLSWYTGREYDEPDYFGIAKVTGDTVNIRAAASATSQRLGTAIKGAIFERRAGDVEGWTAVMFKGKPAFISSKLVAMITG